MGAWDTGIFDNDNAADFSSSVQDCSDVQARHDLLMATMGAVLERDIRDDEITQDFEMGHEVEHALASAAYVADAKNGRHQFTDNPYAMAMDREKDLEDDGAWLHIDLGTPPPALVERAVLLVEKVLLAMVTARLEKAWRAPSEELYQALLQPKKDA